MGCTSSISHKGEVANGSVAAFYDKYKLGQKLGQGAFGQVRVAMRVDAAAGSEKEIAVKILDLRDNGEATEPDKELQKAALLEERLWIAVGQHPNCVRLHEVFHTSSLCYMVMEKCCSSLFQHLEQITRLTETVIGGLLAQMLQGLARVHEAHIVHRDVKPGNFLMGGGDGKTVKLTDFGLSDRISKGRKLHGVAGTAPFMSPELLGNDGYDEKTDVWSTGVIAYVFLFGTFPYLPKEPSTRLMKLAIVDGVTPKFEPVVCSSNSAEAHFRTGEAVEFVKKVLQRDPEKRPSSNEALDMEFILASKGNRHAAGIGLPSLRPMLKSAMRVGAFELRARETRGNADDVLNVLQTEKGRPPLLAASGPTHRADKMGSISTAGSITHCSTNSATFKSSWSVCKSSSDGSSNMRLRL